MVIIEEENYIQQLERKIRLLEAEIDFMQEDLDWLDCLNEAGVDNWSGWDYASDIYNARYGERND